MQPILAGKHSEQLSPWQWGCALVASHNLVYWGAEVVIAKVLPAPKTALLAESEFLSPWGVSHIQIITKSFALKAEYTKMKIMRMMP